MTRMQMDTVISLKAVEAASPEAFATYHEQQCVICYQHTRAAEVTTAPGGCPLCRRIGPAPLIALLRSREAR